MASCPSDDKLRGCALDFMSDLENWVRAVHRQNAESYGGLEANDVWLAGAQLVYLDEFNRLWSEECDRSQLKNVSASTANKVVSSWLRILYDAINLRQRVV